MYKGLNSQFAKSESRYQFNIDRIAEKYCNASNRRELALQTLQRNLGDACISSPVLELKDKSNKEICQRLNQEFEMEYGKRLCLGRRQSTRRNAPASLKKFENRFSKIEWNKQFDAVGKYTPRNIAVHPNITNMLTNSVDEGSYEEENKKLREVGSIYNHVIDVIKSPIKEGPVKIHINNQIKTPTLKNAPKFRSLRFSLNRERFTFAKNETFLDAWFRNAEKYWTNASFIPDHSFRWRAAYNARRTAQRNLGYVHMSDL